LGPSSFHHLRRTWQVPQPTRRARRCLLKDCECWFLPTYPQARYCGPKCSAAARRWRRVQASRRYRASAKGRQRRCAANRCYRQRRRARAAALTRPPTPREGKRPARPCQNFAERLCDRPGCYIRFQPKHGQSSQRFCSLNCRLALRRVLDREARYRQRRRRWRKLHPASRRRPPDTS